MQPIIDLHCDLLSYLAAHSEATPDDVDAIGCALPHLRAGNVKLQVLALYTSTETGSSDFVARQAEVFADLLRKRVFIEINGEALSGLASQPNMIGLPALENASGFCEEDEALDSGFEKLEALLRTLGRVLYITMTHHTENRFGGGNLTDIGLKADGKRLLEYLGGRGIAIDFSHTSDAFAHDILNHIDSKGLDLPVLASHSNFRAVWQQARNLPDEIAREIIRRGGVIGVNFVRAFVDDDRPETLHRHILRTHELEGERSVAFGADYFFPGDHPDTSRRPFFHPQHQNASCYPSLLETLAGDLSETDIVALAHGNAGRFIQSVLFAK